MAWNKFGNKSGGFNRSGNKKQRPAFEIQENRGSLFHNSKRENAFGPFLTGEVNVDGLKRVAAFLNLKGKLRDDKAAQRNAKDVAEQIIELLEDGGLYIGLQFEDKDAWQAGLEANKGRGQQKSRPRREEPEEEDEEDFESDEDEEDSPWDQEEEDDIDETNEDDVADDEEDEAPVKPSKPSASKSKPATKSNGKASTKPAATKAATKPAKKAARAPKATNRSKK